METIRVNDAMKLFIFGAGAYTKGSKHIIISIDFLAERTG